MEWSGLPHATSDQYPSKDRLLHHFIDLDHLPIFSALTSPSPIITTVIQLVGHYDSSKRQSILNSARISFLSFASNKSSYILLVVEITRLINVCLHMSDQYIVKDLASLPATYFFIVVRNFIPDDDRKPGRRERIRSTSDWYHLLWLQDVWMHHRHGYITPLFHRQWDRMNTQHRHHLITTAGKSITQVGINMTKDDHDKSTNWSIKGELRLDKSDTRFSKVKVPKGHWKIYTQAHCKYNGNESSLGYSAS